MLEKTKKISWANSPIRAFALSAFCLLLSAFLPLANFAQTIPDEIFGEYVGDATMTIELIGLSQPIPEITVVVENRNSADDYFITFPDLDLMGIGIPVEFDNVSIAPYSDGYKLLKTDPIAFTIEGVSLPEIGPIPAGVYDISLAISLGDSKIIEYALNMNINMTAHLIYYIEPWHIPVEIPIPIEINIAFDGLHEAPPPTPPTITTTDLPSGIEKQEYNALFEATGDAPITWSIIAGNLPTGITLNPTTGAISGTPTEPNTFTFTVQASNLGGTDSKLFTIVIEEEEDTVGIRKPEMEMFKIYPNPTTSELRVESGELKVNSVEVFDIYGKKLSQLSTFNSQLSTQISVSQLPAGVYIIKIQTDKGVYKQQFIKK